MTLAENEEKERKEKGPLLGYTMANGLLITVVCVTL